jgi:hypothetical protein
VVSLWSEPDYIISSCIDPIMLEIVGFWNDDSAAQWYRTLCPHLQDCERESLILETVYFPFFSRSMYQQDIRHCCHLFSYLTMDLS